MNSMTPDFKNTATSINRQSAFAFIFTRDLALWVDHHEKKEQKGHLRGPAFLMQLRPDYMVGMFGGGIKDGMNTREGLLSELQEEAGLVVTQDRLEHVCTHRFSKAEKPDTIYETALYGLEMSADDFMHTHKNVMNHAEHAPSEIRGALLISLEDYNAFERFMSFPMPTSVKEQLIEAFERYELVTPEQLIALKSTLTSHPNLIRLEPQI
jgi:8-oxo-dGTP pyrophosphatase MutT (NUDIX family)